MSQCTPLMSSPRALSDHASKQSLQISNFLAEFSCKEMGWELPFCGGTTYQSGSSSGIVNQQASITIAAPPEPFIFNVNAHFILSNSTSGGMIDSNAGKAVIDCLRKDKQTRTRQDSTECSKSTERAKRGRNARCGREILRHLLTQYTVLGCSDE